MPTEPTTPAADVATHSRLTVVGCGSAKLAGRHPARTLYTGNLFRAHLKLAQQIGNGPVFVASAKHGLIGLDDELDSYDFSISSFGPGELGDWRRRVAGSIEAVTTPRALVCVLAGSAYASWSDACHRRCWQPLAGLMLGERLSVMSRMAAGS